jgi:hypothetical protein
MTILTCSSLLAAAVLFVGGTLLLTAATSPDVIYYVGTNLHVNELRFNGNYWTTTDVTATTGAPTAASGSGLTGHLYYSSDNVWYVASDQHVHELAYYQSAWHTSDITSLAGAPDAISNSALTSHMLGSSDNIYFIAVDSHIHELAFYGSPATWHTVDITAKAGAPDPTQGSPLTGETNTVNNTESTFFIGSDQHVHQISFNGSSSQWGAADLTYLTGAPDATPGSSLTSHMYGNSENVYYIATDGDIHEFAYYGSPAQWYTSNVTAPSGGPSPVGGSALAGNQNGSYDDVYFIAPGPLVFLVWFNPSGDVWKPADITDSAGAPAPAQATALNSHVWLGTTPEVFCFTPNQHVQELAFYSNAWHGSDLTKLTGSPLAEVGSPVIGFTGI